jgi:O-acetylserine/cysteine efflux transporter
MPLRHRILAVAVALVWGVNFVFIHDGERTFPPLLFVSLRYALVAFPAVLFIPRPRIPLGYVIGVGLILSGLTQALLFVSIDSGMPAGLASLVLQLQAVFTAGLAVVLLGETLSRRQAAGAATATAGIALIGGERAGGHLPVTALFICVGAALSWGAGNIIVRRANASAALGLVVWSSLAPPLPLLGLALLTEGGPVALSRPLTSAGPGALGALLFVVVAATGFGFGSWAWLLQRHAASRVAPFSLLVPVFGIAAAWIALAERPHPLELAGAGLILAGLGLLVLPARRRRGTCLAPVTPPTGPAERSAAAGQTP